MPFTVNGTGSRSAWKIYAAIAASFVIHGSTLVLPYLGSSADPSSAGTHFAGLAQAPLKARLSNNNLPAPPADSGFFAPGQNAAVDAPAGTPTATEVRPETPQRNGLGLLPIEGTAYYPTSQLTQRPAPINEVALDDPVVVPVIASGKMVMTLWINAQGEVENAAVEETELPGLFTRPAIQAFKRLRFKPGEMNGRSVGTIMKIEVTYEDSRASVMPPAKVFSGDEVAKP